MRKLVVISSVVLIAVAAVIVEEPEPEYDNPRYRQVRNNQPGNGGRPGRGPPPPAYYVETPTENGGQRVYQKNRAEEKIHEQLGVLGVVAQDNNGRENPPSESTAGQNQNGRNRPSESTAGRNQNGRNRPSESTAGRNQNGRNRPSQNNRG